MKKLLLLILFFAGTANIMFAQAPNQYMYYNGYYEGLGFPVSKTDMLFNNPRPGKASINFHFLNLKNSAKFTLELIDLRQLKHLPDLDSLLKLVKENLGTISDSLKEDGINRRVDYVFTSKDPQIRIVNHDNRPKQYVIKSGELNELKIEQDTLRIKGFAIIKGTDSANKRNGRFTNFTNQPFFITLLVNNINDVKSFDADALQKCIALLQTDVSNEYIAGEAPSQPHTAYYDMRTIKRFSPGKVKWIKYTAAGYSDELVPNIYAGFGYARGNFISTISAGLRYTFMNNNFATRRLYLMWEPHFIFTRDLANKLITDRNDFVTLRYINVFKKKNEGFDFVDNTSIGYLVHRTGNWFEPGTWKIGIPGVRSGWLQLEPEFFFNGFFKGFSPSLKLTIHYE